MGNRLRSALFDVRTMLWFGSLTYSKSLLGWSYALFW